MSKVYLETTVISYLASRPSRDLVLASHQQITHDWWETRREQFDLFVSELVAREAGAGDPTAAERRLETISSLPLLELNREALALADAFVSRGALPQTAAEDALHIALATVHGMDYLLTWNCTHIANAAIRYKLGELCYAHDYELPVICTPEELMES